MANTEESYLSKEEKIESLYQALKRHLEIVSIELEGQDDAQVIFETLNARGEPLLPSDLLRNYLFWRASQKKESQDDLYKAYWAQFDSHFWKTEEKQGRLKRPRIDLFMQHFLQAKKASEVNIGRMYTEYKAWIKETNPYPTIESELIDLSKYSQVYKKFLTPETASGLGTFAWRLRQLDVSTVYPLMLWHIVDARLPDTEIAGIITDIESYLIRRLVCGKTTKNYNKTFMQLLRDSRTNGPGRTSIQKGLLSLSGDTVYWPNDKDFENDFVGKAIYGSTGQGKIQLVLLAIEDALHNEKSENITINSELTIEHIMPQTWQNSWPTLDGKYVTNINEEIQKNNQSVIIRELLKNSFGNLTLLTHKLNSSVSNADYNTKRPEIIKQSALRLNSYFHDIHSWDESAILKRGKALFDRALSIWPYPKN